MSEDLYQGNSGDVKFVPPMLVFTAFVAVSRLFPCTTIGPVPSHNRASFPKEPSYCYTSLLTFHGRTPLIPPWYRLRIHKKTDIWLLKIVAWHAHGGLNQNFSFTSLQLLKKAWDCIQSNVCGLWCFPNDLDWFLLIECLWAKSLYTLFSKRKAKWIHLLKCQQSVGFRSVGKPNLKYIWGYLYYINTVVLGCGHLFHTPKIPFVNRHFGKVSVPDPCISYTKSVLI